MKWLLKAADQGDLKATLKCGLNYYVGLGVDVDLIKSREYLQRAADKGNFIAPMVLESMTVGPNT